MGRLAAKAAAAAPAAAGERGPPSLSEIWARRLGGEAGEQTSAASRAATAERDRRRRGAILAASAGGVGLCCSAVTSLPPLAGSGAATPLAALGLALAAAQIGILARCAFRGAGREVGLADAAARAAVASAWAARLTRTLDAAQRDGAWPPYLRALDELVGAVEADLQQAGRIARRARTSANRRRHRRIVPRHRKVIVRTPDGRDLTGIIADVSPSGVSLSEALPRVAVGESLLVGRRPATVVRVWDRGVAMEFKDELDAASFDEAIVL